MKEEFPDKVRTASDYQKLVPQLGELLFTLIMGGLLQQLCGGGGLQG